MIWSIITLAALIVFIIVAISMIKSNNRVKERLDEDIDETKKFLHSINKQSAFNREYQSNCQNLEKRVKALESKSTSKSQVKRLKVVKNVKKT